MLITMMNTGIYWDILTCHQYVSVYTLIYLLIPGIYYNIPGISIFSYILSICSSILGICAKYQVYDWSFSMPCHMEGPFPMPCHLADSRQYDPYVHCHILVTYIYSFSSFPLTHCVIQYLITYDMYFRYAGFLWHVSNTEIHLVYAVIYSS